MWLKYSSGIHYFWHGMWVEISESLGGICKDISSTKSIPCFWKQFWTLVVWSILDSILLFFFLRGKNSTIYQCELIPSCSDFVLPNFIQCCVSFIIVLVLIYFVYTSLVKNMDEVPTAKGKGWYCKLEWDPYCC